MKQLNLAQQFCAILVICSAVPALSTAQTLTTLVNFNGTNGGSPYAPLIQGSDGAFYGTTSLGGTSPIHPYGTVFRITADGSLTILYSFCSQPQCADGSMPWAPLVLANDGNFYGTTSAGGYDQGDCLAIGCGTVFRITPSGTLTTLYRFTSTGGIFTGLVQGPDGYLYGSLSGQSLGMYFKISLGGQFVYLAAAPAASQMVVGRDGNLYGTTFGGGNLSCSSSGCGTVFRMTPSGAFTILYRFCSQANCSDGFFPYAALVQASDGNFYGTTTQGGSGRYRNTNNAVGTIFKITPNGTLTTLYSFCSQSACSDGDDPYGALVQGSDGSFYGTTQFGPGTIELPGGGVIFKFSPTSGFTVLYTFCSLSSCSDGEGSQAGLLPAGNATFYGTTVGGGLNGGGTVFSLQANASTLTVSTLGIGGMVTSTDGYINCPGICSHEYSDNTPVTLNASPSDGWSFSGWSGACVGVGACNLVVTQNVATSGYFLQPGMGSQFTPVTPCRLEDTRNDRGPVLGGTARTFIVPLLGGCNIPLSATAYSLNVTVVPREPLGYLTIWPAGQAQPNVSTMNSQDGRTKADAAIVPAGVNQAVTVYVSNTTDVILDIDGYFAPPSSQTLQFYPLTPCRVVDTRAGSQQPQGLGPPSLRAMQIRQLPILMTPCPGLPPAPKAYSFNVTVVPYPAGQPENYVTLWPSDQQQPIVSTLNNPTATVVANAAVVPAAANGDVSVFAYNSTDLIIDLNGYFDVPGQGGYSFYPAPPCRVYDSRNNGGQPFSGERTVDVADSPCAPPDSANSYVFNATVVPRGSLGYLTLWPNGEMQPVVSTLNAYDGFITSNMAIVPNEDGSIDAFAQGMTHLILDISGHFAP